MRFEDFLAWEARQEVKYEFDGFEPVAMAGGSSTTFSPSWTSRRSSMLFM